MHFVTADQVVDHGRVSTEAASRGQNSKHVQQLQLVLLSDDVLEEVPDAEAREYSIHDASQNHCDPHDI